MWLGIVIGSKGLEKRFEYNFLKCAIYIFIHIQFKIGREKDIFYISYKKKVRVNLIAFVVFSL